MKLHLNNCKSMLSCVKYRKHLPSLRNVEILFTRCLSNVVVVLLKFENRISKVTFHFWIGRKEVGRKWKESSGYCWIYFQNFFLLKMLEITNKKNRFVIWEDAILFWEMQYCLLVRDLTNVMDIFKLSANVLLRR